LDKKILKALNCTLVAALILSAIPIIANAQPQVYMWTEPSSISLDTAHHSIGYRFTLTVWLEADAKSVGAWQFYMTYNKDLLKVVDFGLTGTGGARSQFFENTGTATWGMVSSEGDHNATHKYIQIGESWKSGPWGTRRGSLAYVTFEVIKVPGKGEVINSAINLENVGEDTVALDPSMSNILEEAYGCSYTFEWIAPGPVGIGVSPVSQEFGMFDNVTGWPVNVRIDILDLSAAWFLTNASFKLSYDPTLVSITADNITVDTSKWDVAAVVTVTDGEIAFYVETSQNLYGSSVKVADLTFTIIYQGTYPEVKECQLTFSDVAMYDHVMQIPTKAPVNGLIRIIGYVALPMPHLEVSPTSVVIGPGPSVGKTFSVNVLMKGLYEQWNLVGYSFRMTYDPTMLEVVDVVEGPFLSTTTSWGYVDFGVIELPAAGPPYYVSLIDIIVKVQLTRSGTYRFTLDAPSNVRVIINGTLTNTFTVSTVTVPYSTTRLIEIRNYNAVPVAYDYKLKCEPTTWGVTVSANVTGSLIEYPWVRNVAQPPYSWFFQAVENYPIPHIAIGGLVATDTGEWYIFPKGDGVLATITFKVLKQKPYDLTCALNLFDIVMIDKEGKDIPFEPPINGTVTIKAFSLTGRQIDVYTQYPAPYGGQGPNMPSDMFTPQQEVVLYAKVTYNNYPVQNKQVAFEIKDPQGNVWDVKYDDTDNNGIATTTFRMPWPCENPETLFGVWTVIGTVEIAEVVVNDTLQFHYDYLVNIVKVTTDDVSYAHGDTVTVTVKLTSHSQQARNVIVTVALVDELGYTVAFATQTLTVKGATFCTAKEYKLTFQLTILKWAAAGVATVHVNCFNKYPSNGGVPVCPEYTPPPEIFIEPY
jgi:hypothetical protein